MDITLSARAALLGRRLGAYAIDCLLLLLLLAAVQVLLAVSGTHPLVGRDFRLAASPSPAVLHFWVFACTTLPFAAAFALCFASRGGATPGQRLLGLRVARLHGERLGAAGALARAAVMLVPFEVNHALLFHLAPHSDTSPAWFLTGLAAFWALCSLYLPLPLLRRDGRSLHDLAAGARVLRA
jgi:uncharacterized RDD family membrane protein YckC